MHFSCLLSSKPAISCFHLWNNPFFRHKHCFKSVQFVGGYCTVYPFGNVALYSLQLGVPRADHKPEAISDEGPLHQRKMQTWEWGTVLLPGASIPTVAMLSRMDSSTGRTESKVCLVQRRRVGEASFWRWWSVPQWWVAFMPQLAQWPRDCVRSGKASCGCLQQGNPDTERHHQRRKRVENSDHLFL